MDTKSLYLISYGMYVVGAGSAARGNAQIANTVLQVSSEPPAILVCINKNNFTHDLIRTGKSFSASILARETPLSFIGGLGFKSGRDADKLAGLNVTWGRTGVPIVTDNALAYLEAEVMSETDVLTHTAFVGKLVDAQVLKDGEPMTYAYYHQVKRGTTPRTAPSYVEEKKPAMQYKKYRWALRLNSCPMTGPVRYAERSRASSSRFDVRGNHCGMRWSYFRKGHNACGGPFCTVSRISGSLSRSLCAG